MGKRISELFKKGGGIFRNDIELPPTSTPPAHIAYQVNSEKLMPFLKYEGTDKVLVGLQIEFKKTDTIKYPHPKITQLFFNPNATNAYFFQKVDTGIQLEIIEIKSIEVHDAAPPNDPLEWASLGNFTPPANPDLTYEKFEFFEATRLVYFPIEPLIFLTFLHDNLVISGSKLVLGRKLYHPYLDPNVPNPENENKTFKESYFSLKIEGGTLSASYNTLTEIEPSNLVDTKGPDIAVGHPCPPTWESFLAVFTSVLGHYPNDTQTLLNKVWKIYGSWLKS